MYKTDSFKTGEEFHQVALDIIPGDDLHDIEDFHWFVPSIVNMSFACELYLKSILSDGNSETKGHDLSIPFSKLDADLKISIKTSLDREGLSDFDTLLEDSKKLFEDWRYRFEKGKRPSVHLLFLEKFARILHDTANSLLCETSNLM